MFTQVTQQQFTVVLGISGSGKSSLVKAGVIPYLKQQQPQRWQIIEPIRPGIDPYKSLAIALSTLNSNEQIGETSLLGKKLKQQDKSPLNPPYQTAKHPLIPPRVGGSGGLGDFQEFSPQNWGAGGAKNSNNLADRTVLMFSNQLTNSIQSWSQQHPDYRLLLVIDQFEELITLSQKTMPVKGEQKLSWWQKLKSQWGLGKKVSNADSNE